MTDQDYRLLYSFIKIKDAKVRDVLYRERLDAALNELCVSLMTRSDHFKGLMNHFNMWPDDVIHDTITHVLEACTQFKSTKNPSTPQIQLRPYIITIIRSYWAGEWGRESGEGREPKNLLKPERKFLTPLFMNDKNDRKKYPGYKPNDTKWDELQKSQGAMTNEEFFTSNGKGGFYEGMEWDARKEEWVPNAETRRREHVAKATWYCFTCESHKSFCECNTKSSYSDDEY